MEDERIVALFFERSELAIRALDDKYGALCRAVAFNILADAQDAEECVSDAYLGAWNAIPPARPDPLRAYIIKIVQIVRNLSVKAYRTKRAVKRSGYTVALEELDECIADKKTVEDTVEAAELGGIIERFLDTLSAKERVIFMRRYAFADSYAEIAERVGVSEKNVSVRLSVTRQKLRQFLIEKEVLQ